MNLNRNNWQQLPMPDAEVYYVPAFFSKEESDRYFTDLQQQVAWQQQYIRMFGKKIPMPRLTAWYGDKGYTYSGLHNKPKPWLPALEQLKHRLEVTTGTRYNSVLLNLYRNGNDSMGWHSDDEPELSQEAGIASVSFGGARRFGFRHKTNRQLKSLYLTLQHGSLLLMQGATQHFWQHSIPKTATAVEPRINITFRYVL